MKFGDYLRDRRDELGLTQPDAAKKAGIEQSYLSKLETGKSYPSDDVFKGLIDAYGLDVSAMTKAISNKEIEKLREVGVVQTTVNKLKKQEKRYMRSWILASLFFFVFGTASTTLGFILDTGGHMLYTYTSPGIVQEGEHILIFEYGFLDRDQQKRIPSERYVSHTIEQFTDMGDFYFKPVNGGTRRYEKVGEPYYREAPDIEVLFLTLGALFLSAALGCFFISSRWR